MEELKPQDPDSIILEEEIDPNYVPTEAEVVEYAKWLGMDLDKDQDLFWIAREGLMAPLPPSWKPCKTKDTDDVYYFNFTTGESTWDHPCDGYYKRQYEEQKKKKEITNKDKSDAKKTQAKKDVSLLTGKEDKKTRKSFDLGTLKIPNVTGATASLERKPLPGIAALPNTLTRADSLPAPTLTNSLKDKNNSDRDNRPDREVERLTGSTSDVGLLAGKSKASSKLLAAMGGESEPKPQFLSKSADFKSDSKVESTFTKKLPKDRVALGKTSDASPIATSRDDKQRSTESSSEFEASPPFPRKLATSPVQDGPSPNRLHNPDREQLKIAQQNLAAFRQSAEDREEKLRDRISALITENETLKSDRNTSNSMTGTVNDAELSELRAVKNENKKITESFQLKLLNQETEANSRISKLENEKKMIMIENERLTRMSQSPALSNSTTSEDVVYQLKRTIQSQNDEVASLRLNLLNAENRAATDMGDANRKVIDLLEKVEALQLKLITQENEYLSRINKLESEKRELNMAKIQAESARNSPSVQLMSSQQDSELVNQLRKKIELLEESAKKQQSDNSSVGVASSSSLESKFIIERQKLIDEVDDLRLRLSRQETDLKNQLRRIEDEKRDLLQQIKQLNNTVSDLQLTASSNSSTSNNSRSESPELLKQLRLKIERMEGELSALHANEITHELQTIEQTEAHHKQLTELQQQLNEVKLKNLSLSKSVSDLTMSSEANKATHQVEISHMQSTIAQLESKLSENEKTRSSSAQSDSEVVTQLKKKIEQLEDQTSSLSKLEADLKVAQDLAASNERRYLTAQQHYDTLQTRLSVMQTEHSAHVTKLEANNNTLQALSSASDSETAVKLKSALQENERNIHLIVEVQQELEVAQHKLLTAEYEVTRLQDIETEKSKLLIENTRLQSLNSSLVQSNAAEDLKNQLRTLQEKLRLKSIEKEDDQMLWNQKLSRLESDNAQLTEQLETEKALVQLKDKNIAGFREELVQVNKKLPKPVSYRVVETQTDESSEHLEPAVTVNDEVAAEEVSRLKVEMSVNRAMSDALKVELIKVRETLQSKEASIAAYLQVIEELQSASISSSSGNNNGETSVDNGAAIISLRKSLHTKETDFKLLTAEHEVLTNKLKNSEEECASYRRSWQDSENSIIKLKGQHMSVMKDKDTAVYQWESKCSTLQQNLLDVSKELDGNKSVLGQLKSELDEKKLKISTLEAKVSKLTTQLQTVSSASSSSSAATAAVSGNAAEALEGVMAKNSAVTSSLEGINGINGIIELSIALGKQQENMTRLEQQLLTMKSQPSPVKRGTSLPSHALDLLPSTSETDDSPLESKKRPQLLRRGHSVGAAGSTPGRVKFQEQYSEKENQFSGNVINNSNKRDSRKLHKTMDDFHINSYSSEEDITALSLLPSPSGDSNDVRADVKQRLRTLKTTIQKIDTLETKQNMRNSTVNDIHEYVEEQTKILKLEGIVITESDQVLRQLGNVIGKNLKKVAALKAEWKRTNNNSTNKHQQGGLSSRVINEHTKAVNDSLDVQKSLCDVMKSRSDKLVEMKSMVSEVSSLVDSSDLRGAVKLVQKIQQQQEKLSKAVICDVFDRLVDLNETVMTFSTPTPEAIRHQPHPQQQQQQGIKRAISIRQPSFDDSYIEYANIPQSHVRPTHQPYVINQAAEFIESSAASRGPNSFYRSLSASNPATDAFFKSKPVDRTRVSAQRHIENFERRQQATYKECDDHVNWLNNLQKELVSATHASVGSTKSQQFVSRGVADVENRVNYLAPQSVPSSQVFHI